MIPKFNNKTSLLRLLLALIIPLLLEIILIPANSQQQYVDNNQLNCGTNFSNTNGFVCNGNKSSCSAYVTFRSNLPNYETAPSIAFLLNSSASATAQLNNISDVGHIPEGQLVVVPVSCGCTRIGRNRYYQHNANYTLKEQGESYYTMSHDTYQGLTTCQAMIGQNSYSVTSLVRGDEFIVPIMCACPTTEQVMKYGAQYLVSYLVATGDDITHIAEMFRADMQSVLDANELKFDDVIYPSTPILVPLRSAPTKINLPSPPPAPPPQSNPNPSPSSGSGGSTKKWVFIGIGIGARVLVLCLFAFVWCLFIRRSKKSISTPNVEAKVVEKRGTEAAEYAPLPGSYSTSQGTKSSWSVRTGEFRVTIGSLTAYKFKELEEVTDKFNEANRMKGSVFRGKFKGDNAAIKIMKGNVPTDEINLLKHINHSNIIQLSGYCIHKGSTYLVYEYAEKGSLDEWLFHQQKLHSEDNSTSFPLLGWKESVQIVSNIADAINYLHHFITPPYVHKNLKSSNVLLDATYRAKITNFGMARTVQKEDESGEVHMTKHVVGTHGYLAPEYIENGVITTTLDVFAFGVMVLEILSGKPAVKPMNNGSSGDLLFLAIRKVFEGENVREKLMDFMDSKLGRAYPLDLAYSMAEIAHKCVDRDMNSRPSMSAVTMMLSKIYSSTLDWDPSD